MGSDCASIDIADYEIWEQRRARLRALELVNGAPRQAEFKYSVYLLLRAAVKVGDVDKFIEALEAEERVSLSDIIKIQGPSGNSLLHVAAGIEKADILRALLEVISDKRLAAKENYQGDTALHIAARAGMICTAELLLGCDELLLDNDSILGMTNNAGNTALHEAVKNRRYELTKLLLTRCSRLVNQKNKESKCPLYLAVETGDLEILKLLMGAVDGNDDLRSRIQGMSPVHEAVMHRRIEMLKEMSEQNKDLFNLRDFGGGTPLHLAALMDYVEGVKFLVIKFAWSAFEFDVEGYLPIHIACKMGRLETIKELLQHWPYPEELLTLKGRQNILHVAAKYGMLSVVEYILDSAVSSYSLVPKNPEFEKLKNAKDKEGNTPLHVATLHCQVHVLIRLIRANTVNLHLVNNGNLTALDIADEQREKNDGPSENLTYGVLATAGAPRSVYKEIFQPKGVDLTYAFEPRHLDRLKDVANTRMLVATLIAGMTFTAGLSVPGGYNSSEPDAGFAKLLDKPMYVIFVICNTVALYSSLIAVVLLHWTDRATPDAMARVLRAARAPVVVALAAMSLTFMAGVYMTVSKRIWIAVVALIVGITAPFVILILHSVFTPGFLFKLVSILGKLTKILAKLTQIRAKLTQIQAKLRARQLTTRQAAAARLTSQNP